MKKLVPVLMVVLAAVSIAAVFLWQQLRDMRTQSGDLQARVAELQSAQPLAASPASPTAMSQLQTVAVTANPAGAPGAAAAPQAAASAEKKAGDALEGLAKQMFGTPEGREMMLAQLRMMLPQQYPDLGKELGLTPAETEKFFDMLAKQQMSMTGDALDMLGGNGPQDAASAQERQRKLQQMEQANQTEIAAMLGDKMPKYQEYEKTLPMRQQVNRLQASLGTGNNALSDTQSKPLIAALAAEQTRIQQDRRTAPRPQQQGPTDPQAAMERELDRAAEDNRRLVNVASSYLNPQQLDGYRQQLEQQQNLQRTLMRGMSAGLGARGAGNGQAAPGSAAGR